MQNPLPYLGEGLSLLSAVFWGLAVIFFRKSGKRVHPLALNTFKNLLATLLLIPTMYIVGEQFFCPEPLTSYVLLALSGFVGIGLGDTLLFASLNKLGAGRTGIVVCMYSPFIIILSLIFLDEHLTILQLLGVLLIIVAVLAATSEKQTTPIDKKQLTSGILLGILAAGTAAVGVIIMKPILEQSPLLWATQVRLIGGIIALGMILGLHPRRRQIVHSLTNTRSWSNTITGSVIGAYGAMVVWIAGMKFTQASIASALNQTSTIFIFIFAGLFLKEPVNLKRTMGIILAFLGSYLVSFG
ncbi:DMT family transporter [candidate division WOR-3 bacterium]|nr:DMT family transporter [candidate division WOR-3 bacterium]